MKVYLCDHTFERTDTSQSRWFVALSCAFGDAFVKDETSGPRDAPANHTAYKSSNAVLFVHSQDEASWQQVANNVDCHIVLVRNDGGHEKAVNDKGNLHGCHWSPNAFVNGGGRAALFLGQVRTGDVSALDWSLLQPGPNSLAALSILCQGFLAVEISSAGTASGIGVRAPATPVDWFKPFGMSPQISSAKKISEMMGDAESEASELLAAVVNQREIRELVEAFLIKVLIEPEFHKVRHSMTQTLPGELPTPQGLASAINAVQAMLAAVPAGVFNGMRGQLLELEKNVMALTLHESLQHCRQLKDAVNGDLSKIREGRF